MKRWSLWLAVLLLLLLAACDSGAPQATSTPTPTPGITPTAPIPNVPSQVVHFQTADHIQLAGLLFGKGKSAVICSHELRTSKAIWTETGIPQRLALRGYLVLAYDFRGYGDSAGKVDASTMAVDLQAAIDFIRQQGASEIALLGSSMGGTASLKVAASEPLPAVITLSAPEAFGLTVTDNDVEAISGSKLFINSQDDDYASETQHMYDISTQPKQLQLYPGNAHGVDIFDTPNSASLTTLLLDFISTHMPPS